MRKAMLAIPALVVAGACMNPPLTNAPKAHASPPLITSDANKLTLLGMYPEPLRMSYALYNCPDGRMVVGPLGWKTSSCVSTRAVAANAAPQSSASRDIPMRAGPPARPQAPSSLPSVRPVQTTPASASTARGTVRSGN